MGIRIPSGSRGLRRGFCVGRMKKRKAESGKRERRGDPRGRPVARRTDCHDQRSRRSRNDGLFARGTVGRRDTWVPPYTALFCRGGRPCPPGSARSLWCVGDRLCPSRGRPRGSPLRTGTRSAVKRGVEDAAPYGGEQEVRYGGRGRTPPLRMAGGCGGCLLLWRGQGAGGRQ